MGAAMATYCAQNYGAQKFGRIRKGVNVGLVLTFIFSAIGFAFAVGLKTPLLRLFSEDYASIGGEATLYLYINAGTYLLLGLIYLYRNAIQGMGFSAVTMLSGGIELVMRVFAAFVFARLWGYIGVCSANPVAWLGADIILIVIYAVLYRRHIRPALLRERAEDAAVQAG